MQAWFLDANHARTRVHGVGDDARTGTQDMAGLFSLLQEDKWLTVGRGRGLAKAPRHRRSSPLPQPSLSGTNEPEVGAPSGQE